VIATTIAGLGLANLISSSSFGGERWALRKKSDRTAG
jgi:hypothetical protein